MSVLYRPGMMVGGVAIDMGSLISVGMMGFEKGRVCGQQKQSDTQNMAQTISGGLLQVTK